MIDEQTKIITDVMGVWGWHLLAWIFLVNGFVFLALGKNYFFYAMAALFSLCEYISLTRKWKIEEGESE